jgi:hypothetical protein
MGPFVILPLDVFHGMGFESLELYYLRTIAEYSFIWIVLNSVQYGFCLSQGRVLILRKQAKVFSDKATGNTYKSEAHDPVAMRHIHVDAVSHLCTLAFEFLHIQNLQALLSVLLEDHGSFPFTISTSFR